MDKKETAKGSSAKELARYRERVAGLERERVGMIASTECMLFCEERKASHSTGMDWRTKKRVMMKTVRDWKKQASKTVGARAAGSSTVDTGRGLWAGGCSQPITCKMGGR